MLFFLRYFFLQVDWVIDEAWVSLDEGFKLWRLKEFLSIFLEMEPDNCASFEVISVVFFDAEGIGGRRSPLVLFVIVVLANNFDFGGNQEWGIKSHSKLTNKIKITAFKSLHETSSSRLCNCPNIVDKVVLSHSNTVVYDLHSFLVDICSDLDLQLCIGS